MSTTNDAPEPADAVTDTDAPAPPASSPSRQRRRVLIGVGITLALALLAGAIVAVNTVQAQQLEQAQVDAEAALAEADAAAFAEAVDEAGELAATIQKVLDTLTGEDGEPVLELDLQRLEKVRSALIDEHSTRTDAREATFAAVRELDRVLRVIVADGRTALTAVALAGEAEKESLQEAVQNLSAAPYGMSSSYADRDQLIEAVLAAATAARDAHDKAAVVAGAPPVGGGTTAGGTTSGGTNSGGTTSGGNTSGGGNTPGGGGTTDPPPPPPPPPHPRAALCTSLGFNNNLACLNNEPTYVTTNSAYVDWGTCSAAGAAAYGSHTPGFGGTSRPSYTIPWSYQIVYASSGLGTVKFYLCDM